jgi:hypothetical protein
MKAQKSSRRHSSRCRRQKGPTLFDDLTLSLFYDPTNDVDLWDDESEYESELESILEAEDEDDYDSIKRSERILDVEDDISSSSQGSETYEDEDSNEADSNETGSNEADENTESVTTPETDVKTTETQQLVTKRPAIFTPGSSYPQVDGEKYANERRKHRRITTIWPVRKDRNSGLGVTIKKVRQNVMGVKPDGKAPIDYKHLVDIQSYVKHIASGSSVVEPMNGSKKVETPVRRTGDLIVPVFLEIEAHLVKDEKSSNCHPTLHKEVDMDIDFEGTEKVNIDKGKAKSLSIEVRDEKESKKQPTRRDVMKAQKSSRRHSSRCRRQKGPTLFDDLTLSVCYDCTDDEDLWDDESEYESELESTLEALEIEAHPVKDEKSSNCHPTLHKEVDMDIDFEGTEKVNIDKGKAKSLSIEVRDEKESKKQPTLASQDTRSSNKDRCSLIPNADKPSVPLGADSRPLVHPKASGDVDFEQVKRLYARSVDESAVSLAKTTKEASFASINDAKSVSSKQKEEKVRKSVPPKAKRQTSSSKEGKEKIYDLGVIKRNNAKHRVMALALEVEEKMTRKSRPAFEEKDTVPPKAHEIAPQLVGSENDGKVSKSKDSVAVPMGENIEHVDFQEVKRLYADPSHTKALALAPMAETRKSKANEAVQRSVNDNAFPEEMMAVQSTAGNPMPAAVQDEFELVKRLYSNPDKVKAVFASVGAGAKAESAKPTKLIKSSIQTQSQAKMNEATSLSTNGNTTSREIAFGHPKQNTPPLVTVQDDFEIVKQLYSNPEKVKSFLASEEGKSETAKTTKMNGSSRQTQSQAKSIDGTPLSMNGNEVPREIATVHPNKDGPMAEVVEDNFEIVEQLYSNPDKVKTVLSSGKAEKRTKRSKKHKDATETNILDIPSVITFESSSSFNGLVSDLRHKKQLSKYSRSQEEELVPKETVESFPPPRCKSHKAKMMFEQVFQQKKLHHDIYSSWTFDEAVTLKQLELAKSKRAVVKHVGGLAQVSETESRDQSPSPHHTIRSSMQRDKPNVSRKKKKEQSRISSKHAPKSPNPFSIQVVTLQQSGESESFF